MKRFEFAEELLCRPDSALTQVLQSLTNAFPCVGPRCDVQQALVGFRVLNNRRSFPVHGQNDRTLALLDLLEELGGAAAEGGQRLDIFGEIKHSASQVSTLKGAYKFYTNALSQYAEWHIECDDLRATRIPGDDIRDSGAQNLSRTAT
jgi:hypothetical protein